jgi:hypothetical protein
MGLVLKNNHIEELISFWAVLDTNLQVNDSSVFSQDGSVIFVQYRFLLNTNHEQW